MKEKKCSKCNIVKDIIEFYSHKLTSDGLRPECKVCSKLVKIGGRKRSNRRIASVFCYETKQEFGSLKEASNFIGVSRTSLVKALDKPNLTCGGFHWYTDLLLFETTEVTTNIKTPIFCYETKEEFKTINEAAEKYNVPGTSICRCKNNPNLTAAGHHWCTNLLLFEDIELRKRRQKPIHCYETKQKFPSLKEAAEFFGLKSSTHLSSVSNNPHRTAAGKHFCTSLDVFDGVKLTNGETSVSSYEKEIVDFLESLGISNIITNTRKIISPLELDIYLPDYNLAIEFNGNYWHSEATGTDRLYHQEKTLKCLEKGIKLIQIFEHQWLEKKEIFKSVILNHVGISEKVYARKCKVVELDNVTSFLDNNHLQGSCGSTVKLGLVYNNELVSVMTFGKSRFNKSYDYELIRFCNKLNTAVVGGASKLLSYFKNKYNPESIISYANLQWSDGNLYNKLGFEQSGKSEPNYWWVKRETFLPRYKCQKHKLKKLMETLNLPYDETGTEKSIMESAGFSRLYDCGNIVFFVKYLKST